jgi:hypothetical protein
MNLTNCESQEIKENPKILKAVRLYILFQLLANELENKEDEKNKKIINDIIYEDINACIDNKVKEYLKNPNIISGEINISDVEKWLDKVDNKINTKKTHKKVKINISIPTKEEYYRKDVYYTSDEYDMTMYNAMLSKYYSFRSFCSNTPLFQWVNKYVRK